MNLTNLNVKIGEYKVFTCKVYQDDPYSCIVMVYWTEEGELTCKIVRCLSHPKKVGITLDKTWASVHSEYDATPEELSYWIKFVKFMDI